MVAVTQGLPLPIDQGCIRNAQFFCQHAYRFIAGHQKTNRLLLKLSCVSLSTIAHHCHFPTAWTNCPPNRGRLSLSADWPLEFGISLVLGAWDLELLWVVGYLVIGYFYSLPAAAMNGFNSCIRRANNSSDTCCAPSLQASAGLGCTSMSNASAPIATAPLHIAITRSALPAPWLGSITTGECDSFLRIGMVERSSVL